ncbi:MAG: hypothetical protein WC867_03855 [Candidatus Pacearchaeota archaeon]|jgi:Ca2+/Na+ antiporter
MKNENIYRIFFLIGLTIIFIISLIIIFLSSIIYLLIILILVILVFIFLIIELYIRIQHNIDNNRKFYRQIQNDLIHQLESSNNDLLFLKQFLIDMNHTNEHLIKENREKLDSSILELKEHLIKENREKLDSSILELKGNLDNSMTKINQSLESTKDFLNQKINQNQQDLLKSNRTLASGIEEMFGLQFKYHEENLSKIIKHSSNKTKKGFKKIN